MALDPYGNTTAKPAHEPDYLSTIRSLQVENQRLKDMLRAFGEASHHPLMQVMHPLTPVSLAVGVPDVWGVASLRIRDFQRAGEV